MFGVTVRPDTNDADILRDIPTHYQIGSVNYHNVKRFIDIGAHIGGFTTWVKSQSSDAKGIAVEADLDNYNALITTALHIPNIRVYNARCGYGPDTVVKLVCAGNTGGIGYVSPKTASQHFSEWQMRWNLSRKMVFYPATPLEVFSNGWDMIDVLKLDCEGAEFDILLNAQLETLCKFHHILGEYHSNLGDINTITDRLSGLFILEELRNYGDTGLFCYRNLQ